MIYVLGGGGGLSKCSIIVHIDSGSTVGAYSNSAATTLVKTGKEIGTSGDYVITGLNTGTYYVKATKSGQSTISNALTFSTEGVKEIYLGYRYYLYNHGDQCVSKTGGYSITGWSGGTNPFALTLAPDRIIADGRHDRDGYLGSNNKVTFGSYKTLKFIGKVISTYNNYDSFVCSLFNSKVFNNSPVAVVGVKNIGDFEASLSLEGIGSAYLNFNIKGMTDFKWELYEVYLDDNIS